MEYIKKLVALTALMLAAFMAAALCENHWVNTDAFSQTEGVYVSGGMQSENGVLIEKGESVFFDVSVPENGSYCVVMEYQLPHHLSSDSAVTLTVGGTSEKAEVHDLWQDQGEYVLDRFGNEFIAEQSALDVFHADFLRSYTRIDASPLRFELAKGMCSLSVKADTQPVLVRSVKIASAEELPEYDEYRSQQTHADAPGNGVITIEAEKYTLKSHGYISPANVQDMSLSPYDTYHKRLNVIGTVNEGAGYRLVWEFTADQSAWYSFGMRYAQDTLEDIPSYFDLEIDGRALFAQMQGMGAGYTKGEYEDYFFQDENGQNYRIYLEAGKHTASILFNGAPKQALTDEIHAIMMDMNDVGVEIEKIAGISDDVNRVWDMEQYMPGLEAEMRSWLDRLDACYVELQRLSGMETPGGAVDLRIAKKMIQSLLKDMEHLPSRLAELNEGSGSAAQLLGALLPKLYDQMFAIDRLFFFESDMGDHHVNLLTRLWDGTKEFFYSFSDDSKANHAIASNNENELEFWVAGSVAYVETLQRLSDAYFTPSTGISVRFSVLADANKVLLAVAANEAPDGVLGIASHLPFQMAMRGALADLSSLDGFDEFVRENFNPDVLQPYVFENKVYALCERQDFFITYYRKDLLDKLGIEVPDTWEDVEKIMPALRRRGMSFYVPLSSASGLKPFYATLPFIFQSGGELYTPDGMRAAIGSDAAVQGFKMMCDLYNVYSFDKETVNFYNAFRYGTVPIGVSSLNDYILLTTSAPEISGLWDVALSPGVLQEDGTVSRAYTAATNADIILKDADVEKAWTFIKWWMSTEVQVNYAQMLQNQYGPAYLWNSANLNAFAQLSIDHDHRSVILEAWEHIQEAPSHPATYMMEREISNAWIDTVINGKFYRASLDEAIININRDVLRKLEEFGYVQDGKKVQDFVIRSIRDIISR